MTISCQEMKEMDAHAINVLKIPSIVLMERASLEFIKNIDLEKNKSYTIVAGVGNNGGDGLAIGRHLLLRGKNLDIFILGQPEKASPDFKTNLEILKNLGMDLKFLEDDNIPALKTSLASSDLTIDAIFGIGLKREVEGLYYQAIEYINLYANKVVSVDLPSGLDGDRGKPLGLAVQADKTICFHQTKQGLVDNETYTGLVLVCDIGIPTQSEAYVRNKKIPR